MPAPGTGPVNFFGTQSSLGGAHFSLKATSSDLQGHPQNARPWQRASIVDLVGVVKVVGLIDMVSKYSKT